MSSVPALLLIHDGEMALPICDVAPRWPAGIGPTQVRPRRGSRERATRMGSAAARALALGWLAHACSTLARARAVRARSLGCAEPAFAPLALDGAAHEPA